jgi:hypothetical protein
MKKTPKKILSFSLFLILIFAKNAISAESKYSNNKSSSKYPYLSGDAFFQLKADRLLSDKDSGYKANNLFANIESNFSLNFSKNWSAKTLWKISPDSIYTTRDENFPERTRTFLSKDRGVQFSDTSLLIEELKMQYEDGDMKVFFGKYNPTYGTAHKNEKRIGVFSLDITKDYQIREKLGVGITALLESGDLSINSFFNDTTSLSGSINGRNKEDSKNGLAGNTNSLSSYTITFEGGDLFGVKDLFYNVGYRSLSVSQGNAILARERETGYVVGAEYSYKLGYNSSLIPMFEWSKISNFTGEKNRDANHLIAALIAKYSGWNISFSHIIRDIDQKQRNYNLNDKQTQISVGYKFVNNISIDVSRASMKENNQTFGLFGLLISYDYIF